VQTDPFCRAVLKNEIVLDLLKESFLVYGGDVIYREATNISRMLEVRSYPYFAVFSPIGISANELKLIGRADVSSGLDGVVALLHGCLDQLEEHKREMGAGVAAVQNDRSIMAEQDREFQEQLAKDRAEAEQKKRETEEKQKAEREAKETQQKAEKKTEEISASREEASKTFGPRMEQLLSGCDNVARIVVRVPSGQRFEQKFPHGAKFSLVIEWASLLKYLPHAKHKSDDIEIPEEFHLLTSFPTTKLTEGDKTLEELKLVPSCALIMSSDE